MRAVAYLRVSSAGQVDGHSLDAQSRLFHDLRRGRGWEYAGVYREEGRSAHSESIKRRPVFRQLLDDAGKGTFDVVVVHTLDRWSRNLRVTLESLKTLAQHNIGLVSISENIDYSTPQGKLFTQMLGSFAEYFSESLATHVRKGQSQRAIEGRHLGGIPFGYQSCWSGKDGQRIQKCEPEHIGGVHVIEDEGRAVTELFKRYASGTGTTASLAGWLNGEGFRTRNTKRLPDSSGELTAGPRYFTNASVRTILHNPFYAGYVKHKGERMPGVHDPLITPEQFESVQVMLKKNSGRSSTLSRTAHRDYLLKGLIRCAHCGMNAWAQTYKNGRTYYRETRASNSAGECPAHGGSISCEVPDEQVARIVQAIELPQDWIERALALISEKDEVTRVKEERARVAERLRRLGRAYVDGLFPDIEYRRQKHALETELESLVVPEVDAAQEAGRLITRLPELWYGATLPERHELLTRMLDGVYVDMKGCQSVIAIKPKPSFKAVLQVATTRAGSGITLISKEPSRSSRNGSFAEDLCSWWRRGRVELPVQRGFRGGFYERVR